MADHDGIAPIADRRVNKASGKEVPWEDVVKGYEYEDDKYVVLSEEDFRRANPEAAKTVDIVAFVDLAEIPPLSFETPYYLMPDGDMADEGYTILQKALKDTGKIGVGQFILRGHGNIVVIMDAAYHALTQLGVANPERFNPWYFPTIPEYTSLLDRHGVRAAPRVAA